MAGMNTASIRSIAMVLLAAMLWGTTGTAQSLAPAGLSPYWVGALRLVIASAFFAVLVRPARSPRGGGLRWRAVLLAGACVAVYNLSFFAGVKAAGVAAMALDGGASVRAPWSGMALCLLAGLAYAVYALTNKRLVAQAGAATVNLAVFGAAALLSLPAALLLGGRPTLAAGGWGVVLYLGLVATGLAYLLFSAALRHISGATGVTLALAEPVTAFVLAIAVVGESPAAMAFWGLGGVLAGLLLVIWAELRAQP